MAVSFPGGKPPQKCLKTKSFCRSVAKIGASEQNGVNWSKSPRRGLRRGGARMGFLDRLFKPSDKQDKAQSANIYTRFDIVRASISGTMSNFHMAKDRKTHDVYGL